MTADLPTDWWLTKDVAAYLGIAESTVRAYVARDQMPAPDRMFGRSWAWQPATILAWQAGRPGR